MKKNCFFDPKRACDLTCKAAFEVDDPVDNIDCHFIWLAYHLGESVIELKRVLEGLGSVGLGGSGQSDEGGPPGPKKGKGLPNN